eukprot:3483402-Prymnesium_polylepis.1
MQQHSDVTCTRWARLQSRGTGTSQVRLRKVNLNYGCISSYGGIAVPRDCQLRRESCGTGWWSRIAAKLRDL